MDETDCKALLYLMANGRATWSDLAGYLGLSAPAAADRVQKLEERGVITGYAALVDASAVDLGLTAFVAVTLDRSEHRQGFLKSVNGLAEVQECHHVTGDDDYLLKVRCRDTAHLDRLITDHLKGSPGVARTRTTIALSTAKEGHELSIHPNGIRQSR